MQNLISFLLYSNFAERRVGGEEFRGYRIEKPNFKHVSLPRLTAFPVKRRLARRTKQPENELLEKNQHKSYSCFSLCCNYYQQIRFPVG
jgi:hypothetical protein